MLIHPSLTGTDGSVLINPSTRQPILKDLITASQTSEKAYEYIWDKPGHKGEFKFLKRAYIEYFPPLDWYIASSVYVDEIESVIPGPGKKYFLAVNHLFCILRYFIRTSFKNPDKSLKKTDDFR